MRRAGIASVFALGVVVLILAASPAAAINTCPWACHCASDCSDTCAVGTPMQGIETFTCEEIGRCIGSLDCPDDPSCPAVACTSVINGGGSGDTLTGNSDHECINGFGGADTLSGEAGDDTIYGGDGNDTIFGGSGNDCLFGDGGSDNANGDSGTDLCIAESEASCEL
ncbi:MAG TPA: calcium-binding protein [Thermoanaerobaculia bacterium]|nr:calcium-binding protein [Thermoanaerobaculia bacterium]